MINSIKNTWLDLSEFLKNPNEFERLEQNKKLKIKRLFSILIIDVLIMLIFIPINFGFQKIGLYKSSNPFIYKNLLIIPWQIIFLGIFIIPFIEELVFRLYLRLKQNYSIKFLVFISEIIFRINKEKLWKSIESNWIKYYKHIFYLSAIIFALFHLINFNLDNNSKILLIFIPLLTIPQFLLGLLAGYLRIKYGFLWGVYLHSLHNLIFMVIPLLLATSLLLINHIEILNIENDKYSLKVEEVLFNKTSSKSSVTFKKDYINCKNVKFITLVSKLLKKEEKLIKFNPIENSEKRLNIEYKSISNLEESEKIILNELQRVYKFKINEESILKQSFELKLSNKELLLKNKNEGKNTELFIDSNHNLKLKNADLTELVEVLNSEYDKYFFSNIDLQYKFNFEFKTNDFEKLNYTLRNNYGLFLEPTNLDIKIISIDFE